MNGTFKFSTFPKNELEALTMLYLQSQDLSKLSPEELYDKYNETYQKIKDYHKSNRNITPPTV